jgi:hypothetical protein
MGDVRYRGRSGLIRPLADVALRPLRRLLSKDAAPAVHLLNFVSPSLLRDFFRRRKLKHLSANLGHPAVRNAQTARSA